MKCCPNSLLESVYCHYKSLIQKFTFLLGDNIMVIVSRTMFTVVPRHGAQILFLLGTYLNTFFPSNHSRIQAQCLCLGTKS